MPSLTNPFMVIMVIMIINNDVTENHEADTEIGTKCTKNERERKKKVTGMNNGRNKDEENHYDEDIYIYKRKGRKKFLI